MESFNFSLNKQIALGGIKKAIPNMIYGNTLFIISLIVRPLLFGASIVPANSREYLFLVAALSIIFFVGILVAAAPTIISGALFALWLKKDKAIIISTLAGTITGVQLTKDFLKSNS